MSLYRKYRPLTFADIAGQEHVKTTLQNEIARGVLTHAYLFSGPRAVGKTTTARILSRAVNCLKRSEAESEPCNDCDVCAMILDGRSMDIIEIDAASHTGVDNVRENIIAASRVASSGLRYKVFIIDEVHMLSISAFNALLKVLEEPPSHVLFILATTELHKVPATIVSRCQRFDFKKIKPEDMRARLAKIIVAEKKDVDADVLNEIISLSGGCERDAESLLGQVLALHEKKIDRELASLILPLSNREYVLQLAEDIVAGRQQEALAAVSALIENGIDFGVFTTDLIDYFRDILLIKNGLEAVGESGEQSRQRTAALAERLSEEHILRIIDAFATAQRDARWFTIPQLPLEMAIVRSCQAVKPDVKEANV